MKLKVLSIFSAMVLVLLTILSGCKTTEQSNSTSFYISNTLPYTTADNTTTYTVERVIDGDTIIVNIDGASERVRLIGIDTPESVSSTESKN